MTKIFAIVFDKDKELSKKLTSIHIAHLYCDVTDNDTMDLLKNGSYKYFDKIFLTSSIDNIARLKTEFPNYQSFYVNNTNGIDTKIVDTVSDVNEIIHSYVSNGVKFYNYKTIRELQLTIDNRICVDLDICLVGRTNYRTALKNLAVMVDSIRNCRLIGNEYVLDRITTYYCGENKEVVLKSLKVDTFVNLLMSSAKLHKFELYEQIKNTSLYNLCDKTKYNHTWRAFKCIKDTLTTTSKITICIDISQIDPMTKFIDIQKEMEDVCKSATNQSEKIFTKKDVVALGTNRIMAHYMTLFDQYGTYESGPSRLLSEIQLNEHINFFGKVLMLNSITFDDRSGFVIKTKNLILVTYYGIYEQFKGVKSALENVGYNVFDFPYMKNFNEGGDIKVVDSLKQMLFQIKPDYILWWVFNINTDMFIEIVNMCPLTKQLYYNWDEPYNWTFVDAQIKAKYLSTAFITCTETTQKYIDAGTTHAYCLYPGFSPAIHKPLWSNNYDCDVSFVLTNLYDDPIAYPDQIVSRRKLIDSIYAGQKNHNYTLAIYGPEKFKEQYPLSYRGSIKYDETNQVFNNSRINICTHVVGNKKGYLNERVFLIMASGGLLMVDPVPGVDHILVNGINCILIKQNKICSQIVSIIENYSYYEKIKRNALHTVRNYTWDDWAMRLEEKLLADYRV